MTHGRTPRRLRTRGGPPKSNNFKLQNEDRKSKGSQYPAIQRDSYISCLQIHTHSQISQYFVGHIVFVSSKSWAPDSPLLPRRSSFSLAARFPINQSSQLNSYSPRIDIPMITVNSAIVIENLLIYPRVAMQVNLRESHDQVPFTNILGGHRLPGLSRGGIIQQTLRKRAEGTIRSVTLLRDLRTLTIILPFRYFQRTIGGTAPIDKLLAPSLHPP
ncbi:hypothetical protein CIRG_01594 [Coccidioides immitis RMSCC 2394]|uniref:Uncharacterized protein n=1 Tax=Coccidioides immitis RMSCC 2394 TaxID=404692 RepID=A0A0J6Y368_COCIT|nr:hypothetical protein CIRG_01594 [Coccidioides immitis RMSCC 2394]